MPISSIISGFSSESILRLACGCIGAACLLLPQNASGSGRPETLFMPVPVEDTVLERFKGNGCSNAESFRVCLKDDAGHALIVLCNGTQAGELDSAETGGLLCRHPELKNRLKGTTNAASASQLFGGWLYGKGSFVGTLLDSSMDAASKLKNIADMGAWPCGITIENRFDAAASRDVVGRDFLHFNLMARLYFFYAGIGYHGAKFVGPLTDSLQNDKKNYFNNNSFSWSIGLPFFRYEMQLGAPVLPYYFWLENNIKQVMNGIEEGKTLAYAEWRWERKYLDNRAHVFCLRAGHVAADLLFDRYVYRRGILNLRVENLPSIFGTWGVSWTSASDVWIPGIYLEFPLITYHGPAAGGFRLPFAVMPMRIHFDYYDANRFSLGYTMNIRINIRKITPAGSATGPAKRLP